MDQKMPIQLTQRRIDSSDVVSMERFWIYWAQNHNFDEKISEMKDGKNVPKDWKIREFKPLLDEHGLFCV